MCLNNANSHNFLIKLTLKNGLQQASTRSPKLSFARPEQSKTNKIVDQKITLSLTAYHVIVYSKVVHLEI